MAGGGVSYVVYLYLVRGAPVLEDVPHDSVVAEPREEVENGVVRRQLAALGEAADGEDVAVGRSHVLLVRRGFCPFERFSVYAASPAHELV